LTKDKSYFHQKKKTIYSRYCTIWKNSQSLSRTINL